jgi:hypothetical protein
MRKLAMESRRERVHIRTSATARLAGLAPSMMTAMLTMDVAKVLSVSKVLASLMVDMTTMLASSATAALALLSLSVNLGRNVAALRIVLHILIGFINARFSGLFPVALFSAGVFMRRATLSMVLAMMVCLVTLHGLLLRR